MQKYEVKFCHRLLSIKNFLAYFPTLPYCLCRNKRPSHNKHPPKTVIFQRGEYTKPMGFWWVSFQRGEYPKPMAFDGFWNFFYCFEKLSTRGVYFGKYGILHLFLQHFADVTCAISLINSTVTTPRTVRKLLIHSWQVIKGHFKILTVYNATKGILSQFLVFFAAPVNA